MCSAEMVTKFQVRKDHWITPVGTFSYHHDAAEACKSNDLEPTVNIRHEVEMAKIVDVIAELKKYCKQFKLESLDYFTVAPHVSYDSPNLTVPQQRVHTIAYAVEGGSEGYYVHVGTILRGDGKALPTYMDFGFAKLYDRADASTLATEIQRWLTATDWN